MKMKLLNFLFYRCKCCRPKDDEFGELSDLSDEIKKAGIENEMYMRDPDMDEYAPPEKYEMPDELKEEVQDDWWGATSGSQGTSF